MLNEEPLMQQSVKKLCPYQELSQQVFLFLCVTSFFNRNPVILVCWRNDTKMSLSHDTKSQAIKTPGMKVVVIGKNLKSSCGY